MSCKSALLTGLVLVAFGGRSEACINDSELETHEREFRSNYVDTLEGVGPAEGTPRLVLRDDVLLGAGAMLLVGAFGLATMRDRRARA